MSDEIIEDLRCYCTAKGSALDPCRFEKLQRVSSEIDKKIIDIVGVKSFMDIESLIGESTAEYETYGFVAGFKYAMRIAFACVGQEPDTGAAGNS